MLVHHSSENYDAAASNAAAHARRKLEELIARGRARGAVLLDHVEKHQPRDALVAAPDLCFLPDRARPSAMRVFPGASAEGQEIHPFALGQIVDRAGLPRTYLSRLLDPEHQDWGPLLLSENLNRLYHNGFVGNDNDDEGGRFLLRSVGGDAVQPGELRGFLSSRFKRIDSRPLLDSFAHACGLVGAVPVEGYVTDTRFSIKAVLGQIFEPVPNEVMAFGMVLENSDFGNGALSVSLVMVRLWCTNFAIAETSLRKVHLGSRLTPGIAWSERTLNAETQATASAVHDLVMGRLNERHLGVLGEGIRRAHEEHVAPTAVHDYLKKHLHKSEVDAVSEAFSSADVHNLPAGQTKWRLSNAISWIAGLTENVDRKLHLMRVAGSVVPVPELT